MEESSDSDSYYVDLPSSLTLSLPKHMHLLTYDELCFGRYNFDSFKMQVTPTLAPLVMGWKSNPLSAKMTSVMEEGDEDQMEDETELVRTLHGKNRIGKYHPIFFGRIDHRFPFYFAPQSARVRQIQDRGAFPPPDHHGQSREKQLGKDERGCGR